MPRSREEGRPHGMLGQPCRASPVNLLHSTLYPLSNTSLFSSLYTHMRVCTHTHPHTHTLLFETGSCWPPTVSFAIGVSASTLMIHKDWCPEGGGGKAREGREKVPEEIRSVGATCPVLHFLVRGWQWPLLEKKVGGRWAGAEGSHIPS